MPRTHTKLLPVNLVEYRKATGDLSQSGLADALGITLTTVFRWEKQGAVTLITQYALRGLALAYQLKQLEKRQDNS